MYLTVLQEGKEPLQLGHQGLGVVLSQAEHTVSKASNETGAQGELSPQVADTPLPGYPEPLASAPDEARD